MASFLGLPFTSPWVHAAGAGILLLNLFIALSLLSRKGMRTTLWVGVFYLLFMRIVVEQGGDFDRAAGGTDAWIAPPYLLLMIFLWATWRADPRRFINRETPGGLYWAHAVRVMFGFLWAWDAMYKVRPHS